MSLKLPTPGVAYAPALISSAFAAVERALTRLDGEKLSRRPVLTVAADDVGAAAAGVSVGELYRTGPGVVRVRVA